MAVTPVKQVSFAARGVETGVARLTRAAAAALTVRQSAALPYRVSAGCVQVLLVTSRRSGRWIIPKGHVEPGEAPADAALREVQEETGLDVDVQQILGHVDIPHGDIVYDVADFAATVSGNVPPLAAGDDASEARWVTAGELRDLSTTPQLIPTLARWGVWD